MPVARGPQMNARSAILVGTTGVMIAVVTNMTANSCGVGDLAMLSSTG